MIIKLLKIVNGQTSTNPEVASKTVHAKFYVTMS